MEVFAKDKSDALHALVRSVQRGQVKRIPADQFKTTTEQDAKREAIFEQLWAKRDGLHPIDEDDLGPCEMDRVLFDTTVLCAALLTCGINYKLLELAQIPTLFEPVITEVVVCGR